MPVGGGEKRAEAMSMLAGMYHEMATAPEIADWIADAPQGSPRREQKAAHPRIRAQLHQHDLPLVRFRAPQVAPACAPNSSGANCAQGRLGQLPARLRRRRAPGPRGSPAARRGARARSLRRDDGAVSIPATAPPTSRRSSPNSRASSRTSSPRRSTPRTNAAPSVPLKPLNAPFPIEKQKALGLAMMEAIGFDFAHGRLDVSHHPFCGGVPTDVRMTTRYTTERIPVLAHGHPARNRPRPLRAGPAQGMVALARRQGARHGDPRKPEPVRRKADRPQRRVLGMGDAASCASIWARRPSPAGTSTTCSPTSTWSSAASSASMPTRRPIRSTSSCATRSSRT